MQKLPNATFLRIVLCGTCKSKISKVILVTVLLTLYQLVFVGHLSWHDRRQTCILSECCCDVLCIAASGVWYNYVIALVFWFLVWDTRIERGCYLIKCSYKAAAGSNGADSGYGGQVSRMSPPQNYLPPSTTQFNNSVSGDVTDLNCRL